MKRHCGPTSFVPYQSWYTVHYRVILAILPCQSQSVCAQISIRDIWLFSLHFVPKAGSFSISFIFFLFHFNSTLTAFVGIVSVGFKPINLLMKTGKRKSSRHQNCTMASHQHQRVAWATVAATAVAEMLNSWKQRKQLAKMLNVMAEAPQTITIIMIIKSTA